MIIGFYLTWLICQIEAMQTYDWFFGILHGFFFIPNFLRSCLTGSLYIALDHTTAYTVFYWISAVASLSALIYFVVRPGRFKKDSHHPDTLPDIKTH